MAAMAAADHPRILLHRFLSLELCKELEFVHRSCCSVGYRPSVFSTTLSHLIATNCAHLILPFLPIRERIKEKVEELFGCEFELFVEFTGLISWCRGACIGWHHDDNRPYLKQRDFAAVCYLNNHGKDFEGGMFHFQDGKPSSVCPVAGDALIYTADSRNIHSVDEVMDGERLTLTLWFTRNSAHDEDAKLMALLSQAAENYKFDKRECYLPSPASDNMYWFSHDQSGFDIRCARVHLLGYSFCSTSDVKCTTSASSNDSLELLNEPLRLGRGDEIFVKEFVNSLHALQVLQFYYWKAPELEKSRRETAGDMESSRSSILRKSSDMELKLPCNHELAETILGAIYYKEPETIFDWDGLSAAVAGWENYSTKLRRDLSSFMPYWLSNETIFYVNPLELQICKE
ncbi:uncharacterized protein [Typha angustifolia]|uniref:uncharacterized protein isoform X1 n=1 Tax=Typha angustifolia TaxID=59011 RepID=UPI003C2F5BFE